MGTVKKRNVVREKHKLQGQQADDFAPEQCRQVFRLKMWIGYTLVEYQLVLCEFLLQTRVRLRSSGIRVLQVEAARYTHTTVIIIHTGTYYW